MTQIHNNVLRNGNVTSSECFNLLTTAKDGVSWGDPALTYIEECNMERMMGRSISADSFARPLMWGKVCERYAFTQLPTEYDIRSNITIQHPTISYWTGSPEGNKYDEGRTVYDLKCPHAIKSFFQLVAPLYHGLEGMDAMNAIRNGFTDKRGFKHNKHKDAEKYYWQLVSGGILTNSKYAELILFAPYLKEFDAIKEIVDNWDGNPNHVAWINWSDPAELPLLVNDGPIKNRNVIRFEIPQEDKNLLTAKVLAAGSMLIPFFDEAEQKVTA